jgi:hypothetical protein
MSSAGVAVYGLPEVVVPRVSAAVPLRLRSGPIGPGVWSRLSFWPLEFLRLVAVVYLLPIAILAIGIPIGLVLTGVLLGAGWAWRTIW